MLRLWPLLFVLPVFCACEKTPDAGPQYAYSTDFIASTTFNNNTRWALLDSAGAPFDTLTIIQKDTQVVTPDAGTPGFTVKTYRLQFSKKLIRLDTAGRPDSLRAIADSSRFTAWRYLPFDSAFAGSLTGGPEEVLYFHTNGIIEGNKRQGLSYQGQVNITIPMAGTPSILTSHFTRQTNDSNHTREIWWAKGAGPVSYLDWRNRRVYLKRI